MSACNLAGQEHHINAQHIQNKQCRAGACENITLHVTVYFFSVSQTKWGSCIHRHMSLGCHGRQIHYIFCSMKPSTAKEARQIGQQNAFETSTLHPNLMLWRQYSKVRSLQLNPNAFATWLLMFGIP